MNVLIAYLVMSHDGAQGEAILTDQDRLVLSWPGVGKQPIFRTVNDTLARAAVALGGEYVKNPIWTKLLNDSLISVHPLGGCAMGNDAVLPRHDEHMGFSVKRWLLEPAHAVVLFIDITRAVHPIEHII